MPTAYTPGSISTCDLLLNTLLTMFCHFNDLNVLYFNWLFIAVNVTYISDFVHAVTDETLTTKGLMEGTFRMSILNFAATHYNITHIPGAKVMQHIKYASTEKGKGKPGRLLKYTHLATQDF